MRIKVLFKKITVSENNAIKLSYAGLLLKDTKFAYGGKIKLLHLQNIYPEQKNRFNILYLISSARPCGVNEWVKTCKKVGVKIVWNQNGVGYPAWAGKDYEKVNAPMREIIRRADWVIYQSQFCKISSDEFLGEFKGPKSIIYNCVDTYSFAPRLTMLPLSSLRLIIMGSHENSYRVIRALEVMVILRKMKVDAYLNITGRLLWPGAYREVIKNINLRGLVKYVLISGPYLQKEAPSLYRQAHILLHLKYNDPCPTVLIEAMACGIPAVASRSGGTPELLGEAGGIVLEVPKSWEKAYVPDSEVIAGAVVNIMRNWYEWSQKARKHCVDNFNKEKWIDEHKEIFNKLLANN